MSNEVPTPSPDGTGPAALVREGQTLLKSGNHQQALAIADRLLGEFEASPEILAFAGEVHFSRANFVESERLARTCSDAFPDDFAGPVLRCRALLALGRIGEARDQALELAAKDITDDNHIEILVTVLSGCTQPEAAYPLCKRALELDPYNPAAHRRLALTCRMIGRLDEAIEAAEVALRFDAHDYEMIGLRSVLCTATQQNNHVAELEATLEAGCRTAIGAARVSYAVAKESEELGNYEQSFKYTEAGAKFKRHTINYRLEDDLQTFEKLQDAFTLARFSGGHKGFDNDEPVFVLGLPRTGSTLIERILSSHSAVYAAGELLHLPAAMMEEVRRLGTFADRAELIASVLKADMQTIGRRYIERTRPFTGHTPRFVDKHPLNYLNIGVIRLALPWAKIIHVRRTPLDACYAIYKFLFNEAYGWSYDLDEIAGYYIGYRQLMEHWRMVIPDSIIDFTYEDVVEDLEGEARKLIDAIGLQWEPACLEFHENTAATMTGSAVQVRKQVYASSVGRWRDYEKQLEPVARKLEAAGIDPYSP